MGGRFYFRFFLFLFASFFLVFGLGWLSSQKTQIKQKKELLKASLKWEADRQIGFLDRKLIPINKLIDKISAKINQKAVSSQSLNQTFAKPYFLEISFKDDSDEPSSNFPKASSKERVRVQIDSSLENLFLKLFIFDKRDLNLPLYSKTKEEPELFEALDLDSRRKFLFPEQRLSLNQALSRVRHQVYFEKFTWKGTAYFLLLQAKGSQIFVIFLNKSYFRLDSSSKILFSSFDKNQNRFFYNSNLRNSPKLINTFFKNPSSKYITRKSKTNQTLYYLQKWEGTNLLFIAQKAIPLNFFTFFIEEELNFFLLIALALLCLILLLFVLYAKLSLLSQTYSFLKTALINYSETGSFPEDSSKNSLLSFYRNRQEVLNQITTQDSKPQEEEIQLKELIQKEIKKIKNKYPHLILHEDFQTDIKMFGFQNFFRTILNELLLNAVESMGAMKEQKIDLSLKEEKQHLVLSVRDYGVGLKETEKAFQIYYSTKSQLGVGLNLVQSIVTANQGQVELLSQEEGGLTAVVRLPLSCFLKK